MENIIVGVVTTLVSLWALHFAWKSTKGMVTGESCKCTKECMERCGGVRAEGEPQGK
ncbi:MAG: hypothetical protein HQL32_18360 [Planctomycetes bacterium]|nr:hypothetical protein [Planctomycetota bacterium]